MYCLAKIKKRKRDSAFSRILFRLKKKSKGIKNNFEPVAAVLLLYILPISAKYTKFQSLNIDFLPIM